MNRMREMPYMMLGLGSMGMFASPPASLYRSRGSKIECRLSAPHLLEFYAGERLIGSISQATPNLFIWRDASRGRFGRASGRARSFALAKVALFSKHKMAGVV